MQTKTKQFRGVSGLPLVLSAAALLWLTFSVGALAQTAEVSSAVSAVAPVVPQQVRYTGALVNRSGDTVEAVFSIYATAEGGEPLWTESQQVSVGADGAYTVLLGAATEKGLPQTVFAAGQARWLGVTVDRAEGPRSPLASVAYAMKAGDAETVGGVAAGTLATKSDLAKLSQTVAMVQQTAAVAQLAVQPEDGPTGSGTMNYVPLWTGSATLGSSGIYQSTAGFVGIGTATPRGPLELDTGSVGGTNSTMNLVQTNGSSGNYYASIGLYNTNGLIGNLSALGAGYPSGNLFGANDVVFLGGQQKATTNLIFATNTSGALKLATGGFAPANERMRIGATGGVSVGNSYVATDPGAGNLIVSGKVGVGTAAPAAVLEVNGTAKFDGLVTFATGQTYPGAGTGTITKVTATSPLTGGGSSGAVTVGLNTTTLATTLETTFDNRYAVLSGGNVFDAGITAYQTSGAPAGAFNGQGTNGSTGVYGNSDTGDGVYGRSGAPGPGQAGVFGTAASSSAIGQIQTGAMAGVWGDTGYDFSLVNPSYGVGVMGTADDGIAGEFTNDGNNTPTLSVINYGTGGLGSAGKGTPGLFTTIRASSATGTCGIGGGSMSCTGPIKSLATTGGGQRTVETYAPQAAESWMEDYGTGATEHGVGVVQIDPVFADTVTADTSYHVFLTPLGDSKGLYVVKTGPTSFQVRESGGGTSSIGFDYKIVAKRRGYEAQRLVDVTDRFNAEQAQTKRRMPVAGASPQGSKARVADRLAGMPSVRPAGAPVPVQVQDKASSAQKPLAKPM